MEAIVWEQPHTLPITLHQLSVNNIQGNRRPAEVTMTRYLTLPVEKVAPFTAQKTTSRHQLISSTQEAQISPFSRVFCTQIANFAHNQILSVMCACLLPVLPSVVNYRHCMTLLGKTVALKCYLLMNVLRVLSPLWLYTT